MSTQGRSDEEEPKHQEDSGSWYNQFSDHIDDWWNESASPKLKEYAKDFKDEFTGDEVQATKEKEEKPKLRAD